jgi:peroxiredoxin
MRSTGTFAFSGLLFFGLIFGYGAAAQRAHGQEKTGPAIGTKAPAFTLKDQTGKERTLEEVLKKRKVALVFYRSADWCPFCKKQLVQLQADLKALEDSGFSIVGISYDSVDVLHDFADKRKIAFPLLSDPGSKTIKAYGLLNKEAAGKAEGIPYPGTIVLDRDGMVRAKLFVEGFRERHTARDLIEAGKDIR